MDKRYVVSLITESILMGMNEGFAAMGGPDAEGSRYWTTYRLVEGIVRAALAGEPMPRSHIDDDSLCDLWSKVSCLAAQLARAS